MKRFVIMAILFACLLCSCAATDPATEVRPNKPAAQKAAKQESVLTVTPAERELLAKLVYCEARGESTECQRAVVSVVFNRLASGKWGKTLEQVIFYPNAFTPATSGVIENAEPNEINYAAVDYVLKNGSALPEYVRYFRADRHHTWDGYEGYTVIDNTYFGYFTDWQKGAW